MIIIVMHGGVEVWRGKRERLDEITELEAYNLALDLSETTREVSQGDWLVRIADEP